MKKFVPVLAMALATGMVCFAQDAQPQAPNVEATQTHRQIDPQRQLKVLTKKLQLTADQQNQLLPILQDRATQMQSIRSDASLSQADRRAKLKSLKDDSNSKIEALLNDQQKQTYEQMKQRSHDHMRNRAAKNNG